MALPVLQVRASFPGQKLCMRTDNLFRGQLCGSGLLRFPMSQAGLHAVGFMGSYVCPPRERLCHCRWGPQEEDTQKYKRRQKLYLSDRVRFCCQQRVVVSTAPWPLHSTALVIGGT